MFHKGLYFMGPLFVFGHIIIAVGFFGFLFSVAKSLNRIANALEKENTVIKKEIE